MVPRLVEGRCLYCTLGGPGSIPVEAVRASNVLFHDLVLLVDNLAQRTMHREPCTHCRFDTDMLV
jgi:hypothetical protein